MKLHIVNQSNNPLPAYETKNSAGMDLRAYGTIDADYRGQVCVILINLSDKAFVINSGDRIAQLVIARCEQVETEQVEVLSETERGAGGFGHTGKN